MPVKRLGLVSHGAQPAAVPVAHSVYEWCSEHEIPCTDIDVWRRDQPRRGGQAEVTAAGHPDLFVTLGGDGTFLRGARIAAKDCARVLGVDLGHVGFLTDIPADRITLALDAVHEDRAQIEERMTLTMRTSRELRIPPGVEPLLGYGRGPILPPPPPRRDCPRGANWGVPLDVTALNDVVLEKLVRDRQVSLAVYFAGRLLAAYSADALIMATPTGSTAYSFAANGPVLSPAMDAIVFTPVAPHMPFNRTVITDGDEAITARVLSHSGPVAVSIDGQVRGVLEPGDWICVYRAQTRLRLVRVSPADFYSRLRDRFGLADAPATAIDGAAPSVLVRHTGPVPPDLAHLRLSPVVHE